MQVRRLFRSLGLGWLGSSSTVRAISGPLASGDQHAGRTALIVAAPCLLGLDARVDRVRDRLVSALGPVLVAHRGPFPVLPQPGPKSRGPGAAVGGRRVAGRGRELN